MGYLHQGVFTPSAIGNDGMVYEVPSHIWASEHAEDLFDNGGSLEVRAGQLAVPSGHTHTDTAVILVNRDDVQRLITAINKGEIPSAAPGITTEQVDPYRTGLPGRRTISHLTVPEFRRRAAAGECKPTLKAEAEALWEWAITTHPEGAQPTPGTIENQIRPFYNALVRSTK
jgi:hypothetical protein